MSDLTEDRALTIVAEFSRIALMLRTAPDGEDAALASAIERLNTLGTSVTFTPQFVIVEVLDWTRTAASHEFRSYTQALAGCVSTLHYTAQRVYRQHTKARGSHA